MIRYFKGILLSRLLVLVLLFLAIRIPLILLHIPLTLPELKFMVLGERLSEGFLLYRDVYDTTAPLSAVLFWLLDLLFGRNILVYRLLATFLIFLQGMRLNSTYNRNAVLPDKTYLPALLYFVFGSIFFEFDTLSPQLIGITFLIYSLNYLIVIPKEGSGNPKLFKGGFFIGLAALCHLPYMLFLLLGFFAVIFFAFHAFRSFMLLLCGFLFPYIVAFTFFLYSAALPNFIQYNLLSAWNFNLLLLMPFPDFLKIVSMPALLLASAVLYNVLHTPPLNYQLKFFQLMLLWLPVAVLVIIAGQTLSSLTWLIFLPAFAYFGTYMFLRLAKWWLTEPLFLVLIAAVLLTRYSLLLPQSKYTAIDVSRLALQSHSKYQEIKNNKILVLGDDMNYYVANQLATPYLNWQLALEDFGSLNTYYAVFKIMRNITTAQPDYIVDEAHLMPELISKAPALGEKYKPTGKNLLYKRVR